MTSLNARDQSSSAENTAHPAPVSVLHVDDATYFLDVCRIHLERHGIQVTPVESVSEALPLLASGAFDVILSDYEMPDTDGIGFLKILQKDRCPIPFILFTASDDDDLRIEAMSNGATHYVRKGGDPKVMFAELAYTIGEISWRYRAEEAVDSPRKTPDTQTRYPLSGTRES